MRSATCGSGRLGRRAGPRSTRRSDRHVDRVHRPTRGFRKRPVVRRGLHHVNTAELSSGLDLPTRGRPICHGSKEQEPTMAAAAALKRTAPDSDDVRLLCRPGREGASTSSFDQHSSLRDRLENENAQVICDDHAWGIVPMSGRFARLDSAQWHGGLRPDTRDPVDGRRSPVPRRRACWSKFQ